jgi:Abnormal spindle-like microcephaly-assoc'd, ASPM-SPD-2-Hydin
VSENIRPSVSSFWERAALIVALVVSLGAASCAQMASNSVNAADPNSQSKIVLVPNAVDFSNVALGQKNTQTIRISNEDAKAIQVESIRVTHGGNSFNISGLAFPFSLAPQASRTFNVEFAPKSAGPATATVTIESSLPVNVTFNVKGIGAKNLLKLQTNPASINFGNLVVKGKAQHTVVISNTGNSKVEVDRVTLSGAGFALSQLPAKFELGPQQEASFLVTFSPQTKGSATGSLQFFSKDLGTPLTISLTGAGVDSTSSPSDSSHTVSLTWDASPGNVKGYNVYRSELSDGPFIQLTSIPTPNLDYVDTNVASGQEYFYVVTSVNHGGHESTHSQEISVIIPNP